MSRLNTCEGCAEAGYSRKAIWEQKVVCFIDDALRVISSPCSYDLYDIRKTADDLKLQVELLEGLYADRLAETEKERNANV